MSQFVLKPTLITFKIPIPPNSMADFVDWQAKFNSKVIAYPGFISLEFINPPESENEWLIVQRFSTSDAVSSWRASEQLKKLLEELKKIAGTNEVGETTGSSAAGGVTEMIVVQIKPENESYFKEWSSKIHQAEAKFPGFRGIYVQSPSQTKGTHWITLLQFDSIENLDRWMDSSERKELLKESVPWISSIETHRIISPYQGWFASIAKRGEIPPVWKQSMLVLLVLFPFVILENRYLRPFTTGLGISLETFIGCLISVALISFPIMPIVIWFLGWWLIPNKNQTRTTLLGLFLILLLYLAEIALFK